MPQGLTPEQIDEALSNAIGYRMERSETLPLAKSQAVWTLIKNLRAVQHAVETRPELTTPPGGEGIAQRAAMPLTIGAAGRFGLTETQSELDRQILWQSVLPRIVADFIFQYSGKQSNEAEQKRLINQLPIIGNNQQLSAAKLNSFTQDLLNKSSGLKALLKPSEVGTLAPLVREANDLEAVKSASERLFYNPEAASVEQQLQPRQQPFGGGASVPSATQSPAKQPFAPKPQRANPLLQRVQQ